MKAGRRTRSRLAATAAAGVVENGAASRMMPVILLLTTVALLRCADASTSSSGIANGGTGESSSSGSISLYFSEDEREERILQALERIAGLFSTTTTTTTTTASEGEDREYGEQEDDEEEEDNKQQDDQTAETSHLAEVQQAHSETTNRREPSMPPNSNSQKRRRCHRPSVSSELRPSDEVAGTDGRAHQQPAQETETVESTVQHRNSEQAHDGANKDKEFHSQYYVPSAPMYHVLKNTTASPIARIPSATSPATSAQDHHHHHHYHSTRKVTAETKTEPKAKKQSSASPPQQQQPPPSSANGGMASITTPWVRQFLARCHRDVLLPVPKDFCSDNFNLSLLPPVIEKIAAARTTPMHNSRSRTANSGSSRSSHSKPFPLYRQALKLLVQDGPVPSHVPEPVERAAAALYLLLHQRYVLSPRGLDTVRRRFLLTKSTSSSGGGSSNAASGSSGSSVDPIFGRCPLAACQGMPLLPIGDSDDFFLDGGIATAPLSNTADDDSDDDDNNNNNNNSHQTPLLLVQVANRRAKRYCACCRQVYLHWDSKVDGCAWGTSFCHLFLMVCGEEVFAEWKNTRRRRHPTNRSSHDDGEQPHVPTIFGFRLHPSASQ